MSNYNQSDYATNKNKNSIVYQFLTGERMEITQEDYLKLNPKLTAEDFLDLKKISDGIYHDETKSERNHRRTVKNLLKLGDCVVGTHEEEMIAQVNKEQIITLVNNLIVDSKMTEPQKRRFIKYYGYGKNLRDIAEEEKVSHVAIFKSLCWAKKKINK